MTDDVLMSGDPIPLRKIPFITGWSLRLFADILTNKVGLDFVLITPYEWVENQTQRKVSEENLREILANLKSETDRRIQISLLPATFFIWSNDLESGFSTACLELYAPGDCGHTFNWNPSVFPYDDLIDECPDFSSNPYLSSGTPLSENDLRKQQTLAMYAKWQTRADELHKSNANMPKSWIADRIAKEPIAEGRDVETIRKNICIK